MNDLRIHWNGGEGIRVGVVCKDVPGEALPDHVAEISLLNVGDGKWSIVTRIGRDGGKDAFVSKPAEISAKSASAAQEFVENALGLLLLADAAGKGIATLASAFFAGVASHVAESVDPDARKAIAFAVRRPCSPVGVGPASDEEVMKWFRDSVARAVETWNRNCVLDIREAESGSMPSEIRTWDELKREIDRTLSEAGLDGTVPVVVDKNHPAAHMPNFRKACWAIPPKEKDKLIIL